MGEGARAAFRAWATILVVWSLLFGALLPAIAAAEPAGPAGVICSALSHDGSGRSAPAGHPDHGRLCCALCLTAGLPGAAEPPTGLPLAPVATVVVLAARPPPAAPAARPAATPGRPRAPPSWA